MINQLLKCLTKGSVINDGLGRTRKEEVMVYETEVITVVRMAMLLFWDVTPCRLLGRYESFG
jgi:hypothetical protein